MRRVTAGLCLCATLLGAGAATAAEPAYLDRQRGEMVKALRVEALLSARRTGVGTLDERVLAAMGAVPRHRFVARVLTPLAYFNRPLPVGYGANIASPFVIALMTHLADVQPDDRVLVSNTGADYHTAVLAELGGRVFGLESSSPLALVAQARLRRFGYRNVSLRLGEGRLGWPDQGPFDAIVVKTPQDRVPQRLLQQLAPDGRLVMPLGPADGEQVLTVFSKDDTGRIRSQQVMGVRLRDSRPESG